MKTILKYLVAKGSCLLLFFLISVSAQAQRGGGGSHSGGGGLTGGHTGGGGFHFSGSALRGTGVRASFGPNAGARGNARFAGANGHRGYMPGNGPGVYGHGGKADGYKWRRHGGFFYTHGYYGSGYYPMISFSCGFLDGYVQFYWDDEPYYLSDGFYYKYENNQYTVVEPPIGAQVDTLPPKAEPIIINGRNYYELNGVYYMPFYKANGKIAYQIVGKDGELNTGLDGQTAINPKVGDVVRRLPKDCRKIKIGNDVLYVSADGVYYQEGKDVNGNKVFVIVGIEEGE